MKKTIRLASSLALTSAVAGCLGAPSVPVSQLATSQVTTPLATAQSGVNAGPGFRTAADEAQGTVAIQINWPDRKGQAIPWSANSAIIYLYDSNGVLLNNGRQVVGRPAANPSQPLIAGSLASQTYFRVKATLGVRVVAKMYRDLVGTVSDNSTPIALGSGNMDIYANNINVAKITMTPVTQAAIANVTPTLGGVGQTVSITGANFGFSTGATWSVRFSGIPAATTSRSTDQLITAAIPQGAVTGDLELMVDGIRQVWTGSPYQILTALALPNLTLPQQAFRPLPLTATGTFSNGSTSSVGATALTWSSSNPAIAPIDANGLLRPRAVGNTVVTVTSGNVSATASVNVSTSGAVVLANIVVPQSVMASVSIPVTVPTAAPGNLPVFSAP